MPSVEACLVVLATLQGNAGSRGGGEVCLVFVFEEKKG